MKESKPQFVCCISQRNPSILSLVNDMENINDVYSSHCICCRNAQVTFAENLLLKIMNFDKVKA